MFISIVIHRMGEGVGGDATPTCNHLFTPPLPSPCLLLSLGLGRMDARYKSNVPLLSPTHLLLDTKLSLCYPVPAHNEC